MPLAVHHIVIDAHDLPGLAAFWAEALHWKVLSAREREVVVGPDEHAPVGLCFMPSPDEKVVKNRVHLDLTTGAEDRDAEIQRLLALGAQRVDVGQTGEEPWTVLADPEDTPSIGRPTPKTVTWVVMQDPEGNEFCVLSPRD